MADIISSIETAFGWQVMPSNGKVDFEYDFTDDEQDKAKAELQGLELANIGTMLEQGMIDAFEARAIAIHRGILDPKSLQAMTSPEPADNTGPLEDGDLAPPLDQPIDSPDNEPLSFLEVAGKGEFLRKFDETKHPRKGGKFTKKTTTTEPTPEGDVVSPLAKRLDGFLSILNRTGTLHGNELTVQGAVRDRSADLETYLNNKGFKGAKVTATKTADGMVYKIEGVDGEATQKPKRKRGPRKKKSKATTPATATPTQATESAETKAAKTKLLKGYTKKADTDKAASISHKALVAAIRSGSKDSDLESYIAAYQAELDGLYDDFIENVISDPDDLDMALDDLYDDFINLMPMYLTTGYGVGLAGNEQTAESVKRLKDVGQTSADFMQDSFMAAMIALGVVPGSAADIRAQLEGFRARFRMYAGSMWEAIWQGLRAWTPDTLKVKRVLERNAQHCATCPDKERVYNSFQEMVDSVGLPGDGSDDCLSNCRCTLEVETEAGSGVFGTIAGAPTVYVEPLFEVLR